MTKQITIATPRLLLRGVRAEDAVALHEQFTDPEVMRYWSTPPHPDMERTEKWVSGMMKSAQNGITDFIICLADTSELAPEDHMVIGKIGAFAARPSNEIGYMVARKHWGKGYAREALNAILDYLFNLENDGSLKELDADSTSDSLTNLSQSELQSKWLYPSISADTDPRNAASGGLLKRFGFVETAYLEKNFEYGGEWVDSQYFKLEREQWLGGKTK